jgi:lsr operon transcriptional repressor
MANIDLSRKQMLARVAWLYYEEELTQAEIGERLGLSRVAVNRLLKEAREQNVVKIQIDNTLISSFPTVSELTKRYHLRDAYISQRQDEEELLYLSLARTAASALEQYLQEGITIGVGIGRSLSHMPEYFHPTQNTACRFTSLVGGLNIGSVAVQHNFDILNRLAVQIGGQSSYISAPSFVSKASTRDIIIDDPAVQQNMDIARASAVAIFSVGEIGPSSLLYQLGMLTEGDLGELKSNQACGDILGRFFDASAQELNIGFNHRVIGLSIEEIKKIPTTILVAGGQDKREAIKVLLDHQVANILVTDPLTAEWLVNTA